MPMHPDAPTATIAELLAALRERRTSAVALLDAARAAAESARPLNAIAQADWEGARAVAESRDREAREGRLRGPLHGLPVTVKDLFAVRGWTMAAGTRAVLPRLEVDEAAAVARLRDAGAVIFATTNMHEIALGATGENPWTGDVKNPHDPSRQAGGSSSGAAVAVACGAGVLGLGSDTGGSVRVPANFCGIVGFKPSFGAVPLAGALHLSWTFDHAGPLARCVDDARIGFEVLSRRGTRHAAAGRAPRLAVPSAWLAPRMDPRVRDAFERALAALRAAGAQIESVEAPALDAAWTCYTPIVRAEAAWIHRQALADGGTGFSEGVLAPMRDGAALPAARYLDALAQRAAVRAELAALALGVDAIAMPTAPVPPPPRGQTEVEVANGRMTVRQAVLGQTLPFNVSGLPALTLPMGWVEADGAGLPVGLTLAGAPDADARVLALGAWAERAMAPLRAKHPAGLPAVGPSAT